WERDIAIRATSFISSFPVRTSCPDGGGIFLDPRDSSPMAPCRQAWESQIDNVDSRLHGGRHQPRPLGRTVPMARPQDLLHRYQIELRLSSRNCAASGAAPTADP